MTIAQIKNDRCLFEGRSVTADEAVELQKRTHPFRGTCHLCGRSLRVRRSFTTRQDFEVPAHFRHYPLNRRCPLSGPSRVR
jgi:hypothetical protein